MRDDCDRLQAIRALFLNLSLPTYTDRVQLLPIQAQNITARATRTYVEVWTDGCCSVKGVRVKLALNSQNTVSKEGDKMGSK